MSKNDIATELIKTMESINKQVQAERKERKEEKERLLSLIKNLEEEIQKLKNDIKIKENEMKNFKKENENFKNENERVKKENENFTNENNNIKKLNEDMRKEIENLKKENEEKRKENENLKIEYENIKKENEDWKKELSKGVLIYQDTSKLLLDIVLDFVNKTFNVQYYISIFDLLEQSENNFEILELFSKLNSYDNYSIDDYLFKFFNNLQSYINIKGQNASLDDFLLQKCFKFNNLKTNLELLKKISKINIGNEKKILEIYKEKKDNQMKSLSTTFELIKSKLLKSSLINLNSEKPNFFINEKGNVKEITINMNDVNLIKFYPLFKYQLKNKIHNIQSLTVITSSINVLVLYEILINSEKLTSFNLIYEKNEENKNKDNISLLGALVPKIINKIKTLTSFSIYNIPIEQNVIRNLKDCLMLSNITSLGLNYTQIPQNNFDILSQYFNNNNKLTELILSGFNYDILSILYNTIFSKENNLTSLTLSDNNLTEDNIQMIYDLLIKNPKIKKLNLSKNNLTQKSCTILGGLLNKSNSIEEINLSSCGLTGETVPLLINNKGNSIFKNVILDNNEIGDIGLVIVGNFIKNCSNLNLISLKNVSGSDMGFNPIVNNILNTKSQIKIIQFENNKLITENLIKEIIKNSEKYDEKGIVFSVDDSCIKDKNKKYKCLNLIQ